MTDQELTLRFDFQVRDDARAAQEDQRGAAAVGASNVPVPAQCATRHETYVSLHLKNAVVLLNRDNDLFETFSLCTFYILFLFSKK